MFTGIIEEVGAVKAFDRHSSGTRLVVGAGGVLSDLPIGGSIAVNGVCLTAVNVTNDCFAADLSPETLDRSNLGSLEPGARVNLEPPLSPTGRLSGHFVQGHVDGTGELVGLEEAGDGNWWLTIRVPRELLRYLVYKGSIAIDGISLTIAALDGDLIRIAIIPHTYDVTSLPDQRPGVRVNLECDMIAKHVERLIATMNVTPRSKLTVEELKEQGF